jgi:hypothetical protein
MLHGHPIFRELGGIVAIDPNDTAAVVAAVNRALPGELTEWPGGYPGEIEAALIDAVLSIRANYGQPHNGVRGAVRAWRKWREEVLVDDLAAFDQVDAESLATILEKRQRLSGGALKSAAIIEAAQNLRTAGVLHASQVRVDSSEQKAAYRSVRGLGPVTWVYFLMLLGKPGVKADTWIIRFVEESLDQDRRVGPDEARELLVAAAGELGVDASRLDHNVWTYMRRRRVNGS